jgi:hypothetical protein
MSVTATRTTAYWKSIKQFYTDKEVTISRLVIKFITELKVSGVWNKIHNDDVRDYNFSPDINVIKSVRMSVPGACSTDARNEKCIQNFSRNP